MKIKLDIIIFLLAIALVFCLVFSDAEVVSKRESSDIKSETTILSDTRVQTSKKWKMTYKDCKVRNKLGAFTTAEDGTEFVVAFFEIENISDKLQTFSTVCGEFFLDDIKIAQEAYGAPINDSSQLIAISLDPGTKINGYFLFEASPEWEELEIGYDDSFDCEDTENSIKFKLTKIS